MKLQSKLLTGVLMVVTLATSAVATGLSGSQTAGAAGCYGYVFRQGSTGRCVRDIQALNNYNAPGWANTLTVDGIYGSKTYASIYKFQSNLRVWYPYLSVDGIVGPQTWGQLCDVRQGDANDPGRVPLSYPIWAARDAGCPYAYTFHY